MATLKFDKDAVSENIQTLLSVGIGTRDPDGQASFGNRDIELHQEAIGRSRSPVGATRPVGLGGGVGSNFNQLEDADRMGEIEINTRIGELQAQQFENKAKIQESVMKDSVYATAQQQVDILTDAIRLAPASKRPELTSALAQANQIRDAALGNAEKRAGIELNKQNNLLNADIARLTARQEALAKEAARVGKQKDTTFPQGTINAVLASGVAKDALDANKFLRSSPPATQEMFRQGAIGLSTGKPLEYWNGLIDAGGRKSYQDFLVNSVPPDQQDNVRVAINKMDERMNKARIAVKQSIDVALKDEDTGGALRLQFNEDDDARARMEAELFDGLMRDGNYAGFSGQILRASPQDIDQSWFGQNQDDYEHAKAMQEMVNPESTSIEMGYAQAIKSIMETRGISQQHALGIAGRILENQRTNYDNVNKPLGAGVSQSKFQETLSALNYKLLTINKLRDVEAEQGPALVVGGDLPAGSGLDPADINRALNWVKNQALAAPATTESRTGGRTSPAAPNPSARTTGTPDTGGSVQDLLERSVGKPTNSLEEERNKEILRLFDSQPESIQALLDKIQAQGGNI